MLLRVGTSGYSYAEWKGNFYPPDLKSSEMLRHYAGQLGSVELNNTFYRLPRVDVVAAWAEQVPGDFRFAVKASRRITHEQRLRNSLESVAYLFKVAAILGDKLGPILFQLPPNLKRDVALLKDFLATLPDGCRPALEFRHESWFANDVYSALADRGAALCTADVDDDAKSAPLVATANWGYLRLRRADYAGTELADWSERIAQQPWQEAYAFLKHELKAPLLARELGVCFAQVRAPGVVKTRVESAEPEARRKSAG
jgi:uncharacterized protein YecE (DUF72 family)